ncbi:hypothetical protein CERZMDRAFT_87732 [Cercospora zeae-maydis SCOH1-5]|uniref:FUN14 domain-containing protein n=1 Tax=Cercospora zeae-maydis SCOH1-5 TaxID=717836 RepID=A0A6A6F3H4_9PEZI|nr:hypothetical protein CERZMDRAFT_87732 [Cercospora zeae-maydis SCOH1-5]
MAFRFTPGLFHHTLRTPLLFGGAAFGAGLCFAQSQAFAHSLFFRSRRPILLDSSPASSSSSISSRDWSFGDASAGIQNINSGRWNNARSIRQLSAGSIIGLVTGLVISTFSKSLVLVIGLLVAGVQTAESYGIRLVPYKTIGKYVKGVDVRSAMRENVAFKISFGLMFALSAFAELPQS